MVVGTVVVDGMSRPGGVAIAHCSLVMGTSTPLLSSTLGMEGAMVVTCVKGYLKTLTASGHWDGENTGLVGWYTEVTAF